MEGRRGILGEKWEVPFFEFFAMGIIFDSTDHKIR